MRVLLADDDAVSRLVLRRAIEALGHEVATVEDGVAAWQAVQADPPDVMVTDWLMPGMDGPELCRRIRAAQQGGSSYTYIILATSLSEEEEMAVGMEAGADDCLTKPVQSHQLRTRLIAAARVTALHGRLADQQQRTEQLNAELALVARRDALTGMGNRLAMVEDLEVLRARAGRYGQRFAVALFDLDRFKAYNDRYGHLAGDEALRRCAQALIAGARSGDTLYRFGGEELLAVFPDQTVELAAVAAERMRLAVRCLQVDHAGNPPAGVMTISGGVAGCDRAEPAIDELLHRADQALYLAKDGGRDRIVLGAARP